MLTNFELNNSSDCVNRRLSRWFSTLALIILMFRLQIARSNWLSVIDTNQNNARGYQQDTSPRRPTRSSDVIHLKVNNSNTLHLPTQCDKCSNCQWFSLTQNVNHMWEEHHLNRAGSQWTFHHLLLVCYDWSLHPSVVALAAVFQVLWHSGATFTGFS